MSLEERKEDKKSEEEKEVEGQKCRRGVKHFLELRNWKGGGVQKVMEDEDVKQDENIFGNEGGRREEGEESVLGSGGMEQLEGGTVCAKGKAGKWGQI